ncbi:MAG TPA: iron ABC transporter permease [Gemmataceae bacterium]|nr:iron ABC transporter permease [Gemmataceae bacterium]
MRWRTLPLELALLLFLGVFLIYPLAYVIPNAASDVVFHVRLLNLGSDAEAQVKVKGVLSKALPDQKESIQDLREPGILGSFPTDIPAKTLVDELKKTGAQAEVVAERRWTAFYFWESIGFELKGKASFPYFQIQPNSPFLWECLNNSFLLAFLCTLLTTLVCLPLAYWMTHLRIRGQALLSGLLLVPLLMPPFVGAIGLQRLLGRFGLVNLILMKLDLLDPGRPIDFLGEGGFFGVVLMQVLHLYPILYLNLTAAWANIDPTLEDAARNLGAGEGRVFRTITFPLLLPGYFAGSSLVFVWAFTDLGTPLVFNFTRVLPVQIYDQVSDPQRTNPVAYALVVITLLVTLLLFYAGRWVVSRQSYLGVGKGAISATPQTASPRQTLLIYATIGLLTTLAILPQLGVILTAMTERWLMTPLPESYTSFYFQEVWSNRIASLSMRNSIVYSLCSTLLDLIMGVSLAWLIARRPSWLTSLLDGLATLPLALPGLVLAFGYLTCYSGVSFGPLGPYLDPIRNPVALLIIAYTIRRLPFLTRSALAGLQQIPATLEEAAENLGASRWRVMRTVAMPLIGANLIAGAILTFSFAVLEVSDSLMLAREQKFYPITKAILGLLMRPEDGDMIASALSVYAMAMLATCLLIASLILGRKMGQLFRASS